MDHGLRTKIRNSIFGLQVLGPWSLVHGPFHGPWSIFIANVAQSVEQLIRNEQVVGSIPTVGSS